MKTLLVVMAIITRLTSLDPFTLSGIDTYQATGNVIEPLARTHPLSKEMIPWLAESWSVDTKASTFRIKLRSGVKFHNGKELGAEDVKFTFDAYFDPKFEAASWRGLFEDISEAKVIDARTVEFRMKKLNYLAFQNVLITMRILPQSFYATADAVARRTQLIGTGPFQVARFESGRALELKPFADWWGSGRPAFRLLIKTVTDAKLAEDMFKKGELDQFVLPTGAMPEKLTIDSKKFRLYDNQVSKGEALGLDLNLRRPLFHDRRVREALLVLWDRPMLNMKVYSGRAELALDMFSPKMTYYPPGKPVVFDRARATQLLREAGWSDSNKDSVLDKVVNGERQDLSFTVMVNSSQSERWVSLYAQDAAKAGVRVKIKRLEETSQWWKTLSEGKFDVVAAQGGVSEVAHAVTWRTAAPYNLSGFSSKEVDALLDKLDSEFDLKKRQGIERQVIEKLRADIPQVPGLYMPGERIFLSNRLQVDSEFPHNAWAWRLKD
ncbi:MAG: ABC transporter substrate-binding protein [Bdellovibrionales bacterium]|nr:ABC transporter substrate-binding protein [Bdellovibrionales bacterium]